MDTRTRLNVTVHCLVERSDAHNCRCLEQGYQLWFASVWGFSTERRRNVKCRMLGSEHGLSDINLAEFTNQSVGRTGLYGDRNQWRTGIKISPDVTGGRVWHLKDRAASWYILTIKANQMHYSSNLFSYRTLHVSDRSTVHHQES